ncbi:hypothetical protein F4678DRAFT_442933 [Xylaria arbuscula]|nr:hypothetical protein F4678DRAFT_442933 [Xylaria arbuscula]
MMHPNLFLALAAMAAAAATLTGSLPVVNEVGIITTTSTYRHWSTTMLSALESTLASFTAQVKVASQQIGENNNGHRRREDAGIDKDGVIAMLAIVCVLLELIVMTFILWLLWYTCFRQWCHRKWPQHDPERQRAEQLLNSPRQPADLELGIIHARSPPHWPLTDSMDLQATTPDNYDTETKLEQTRTSTCCVKHSNHTKINPSEISSFSAGPEGLDITDTAIPETYVADTEAVQAHELIITDPDHDPHTPTFHSR